MLIKNISNFCLISDYIRWLSLRLAGVTLKYRCVYRSPFGKFNIVSNDHGRRQKWDFCVSVGKTTFTNHYTADTKSGFRDSVLVSKMYDCYCTIRKNFENFQAMQAAKRLQRLDYMYMKTNHFKMLLIVFSTTHTYLNCIVYRLFCCQQIT